MSPAKTSLEKKNVASWWPNRGGMVENLLPRRQLRSKRDQYRRKLAIDTKNTLFLMSPAKTRLEKKKIASWWPNRAGMVENLIPRRQLRNKRDQYRRKLAIFFYVSCKNEPWKKKCCKLMTKPHRYGGKSHPATPTQEQTRPISTETSNLVEKYAVSKICCVNGHCRNKTLQIDDQIAQIGGKISSRDANSGANETNIDGN